MWSDSQRAKHRSGEDDPPDPEPRVLATPDFSDETVASAVRDAVLATLDRHGISEECRDRLALELRARILAVLFCEISPAPAAPDALDGVDDLDPNLEEPLVAAEPTLEPCAPEVVHEPHAWLTPSDSPVENALRQRLCELEANHARWPEVAQILLQVARRSPYEEDLAALETPESDLLRRRIAKLEQALQDARAAIDRVSGMEHLDQGIASIYREVQGLSQTDSFREAKREMLELVFRANVALQRKAG